MVHSLYPRKLPSSDLRCYSGKSRADDVYVNKPITVGELRQLTVTSASVTELCCQNGTRQPPPPLISVFLRFNEVCVALFAVQ